MKKNLCILYIKFMIVSFMLTACGGTAPVAMTNSVMVTETPAPTAATEIPAKAYEYKDMTVGLIQVGSESDWRSANMRSFIETADALGVNLTHYDYNARRDNQQLIEFQKFIEDPEVNVIVISPFEKTGWNKLLQEAKNAGKIVIFEDRRDDASEDLYATFVNHDFFEEGHKVGREMCKLLEGSERKNIWELAGSVNAAASIDRGKGFREISEKCGIEVTNSQTANWDTIESKQIIETWLKESKDVQGIFGQNDDMALGAIEALKEAGLAPAIDVKIVSIDATSAAFQAMLDGELNVTVECNPLLAPQVYEAALAALNGEILPKWIPVKESVFFMDDPNLTEIAAGRKY